MWLLRKASNLNWSKKSAGGLALVAFSGHLFAGVAELPSWRLAQTPDPAVETMVLLFVEPPLLSDAINSEKIALSGMRQPLCAKWIAESMSELFSKAGLPTKYGGGHLSLAAALASKQQDVQAYRLTLVPVTIQMQPAGFVKQRRTYFDYRVRLFPPEGMTPIFETTASLGRDTDTAFVDGSATRLLKDFSESRLFDFSKELFTKPEKIEMPRDICVAP